MDSLGKRKLTAARKESYELYSSKTKNAATKGMAKARFSPCICKTDSKLYTARSVRSLWAYGQNKHPVSRDRIVASV